MNTITINRYDTLLDNEGEDLLQWTVARAVRHCHQDGTTAEVFTADRSPAGKSNEGWLEFGLLIKYVTGGQMYIGCIQRKLGAAFESHS